MKMKISLDGAGVLESLKIQMLDFFQSQKEQMKEIGCTLKQQMTKHLGRLLTN